MEWSLVKRWATQESPTIHRLLEEGAHGELKTTSAQLPDTVWASICTGTNPGKFEKYFYVQYDPCTGKLKNVPDDAIHGVPFGNISATPVRGFASWIYPNFPLGRPLNGLHLTNWGAHATKTRRASFPETLLAEIDGSLGHHPVGDCDAVDDRPEST